MNQMEEILGRFCIAGKLDAVEEFKRGHINDTFISTWRSEGKEDRYLHQRINSEIFHDVPGLMRNIEIVTGHIKSHLSLHPELSSLPSLTLIPCRSGATYYQDSAGQYWRTYDYIEDVESFDVSPSLNHAFQAGKAFGWFLGVLSELDPATISTPIPNFQNVPLRLTVLEDAVKKDLVGRVAQASELIELALSQRDTMCKLASKSLPIRVTHGDPKINNVLFSKNDGRAVAIVDLDTCMPGTPLYDYGDLIRSAGISAAEDEPDLSKVKVDLELVENITRGFLEEFGRVLYQEEKELLCVAPRVIALSLATRFLSDFLVGDRYFKIASPNHNFQRATTQFAIAREFERSQTDLAEIVENSSLS